MTKVITNNKYYSEIASAIRDKNGTDDTYKPSKMANAISSIASVNILKLDNVSGAKAVAGNKEITITWSDPNDISGAEWIGTLVVRKEGSAPMNVGDGDAIIDTTVRNAYAIDGYIDTGLTNGIEYYYRFFPHTSTIYTDGASISATPTKIIIDKIPVQNGTLLYNGNEQYPSWNNYDESKLKISGDVSGTNAGSYITKFTPNDDCQWKDGTTNSKSVNWNIDKADSNITLSKYNVQLNNNITSSEITVTLDGVENYVAESNDTSMVNVAVNKNVIIISSSNEISGNTIITVSGTADSNHNAPTNKTINVNSDFITLYSFDSATDEQLSTMINAYYNSEISLDDIKSVWNIGDSRTIHINDMNNTVVSESHHANDYEFVILDFGHDILTTPVGDKTKALITVQMKRIMYTDTTSLYIDHANLLLSDECGYMNEINVVNDGWSGCNRRTWCNGEFLNSLPDYIQKLNKKVNKFTILNSKDSTINITSDSVFLLSEAEVFDDISYSYTGEGNKYSYFNSALQRFKQPSYTAYTSSCWWERSPVYSDDNYSFCMVDNNGDKSYQSPNNISGISPAFCM